MDLYSITFMFKSSPNVVRLMFKNEDSAVTAWGLFHAITVSGEHMAWEGRDDYGKRAVIRLADFAAATFAHTNGELNAAQDEQILQAHAQVQLTKKVRADPILQAASRADNSIITPANPFANGQMRQ